MLPMHPKADSSRVVVPTRRSQYVGKERRNVVEERRDCFVGRLNRIAVYLARVAHLLVHLGQDELDDCNFV